MICLPPPPARPQVRKGYESHYVTPESRNDDVGGLSREHPTNAILPSCMMCTLLCYLKDRVATNFMHPRSYPVDDDSFLDHHQDKHNTISESYQ
jgi:hypothetical protein